MQNLRTRPKRTSHSPLGVRENENQSKQAPRGAPGEKHAEKSAPGAKHAEKDTLGAPTGTPVWVPFLLRPGKG
ncbi:hypothetical protein NDU88_005637 [Pleurodeles waltl]|uniref:Uncharacterized protein n=1 Tax=Pleurodeles waltl TaxID=8319 RepID=A0AAV7VLN3_PLEWA|nr:hypothetical protein NDU88_005637 [Pleurodeles waltl]